MNIISSGFEYQVATTDLTTYPTGFMTIKFNKSFGADTQDGVSNSLEIIEMMLDRYLYLSEYLEDDTEECTLDYRLANKAEDIVKDYVSSQEP